MVVALVSHLDSQEEYQYKTQHLVVLQKEKSLSQEKEDREYQEDLILVVVPPFLLMRELWQEIDSLKECLKDPMREDSRGLWKEKKEIM